MQALLLLSGGVLLLVALTLMRTPEQPSVVVVHLEPRRTGSGGCLLFVLSVFLLVIGLSLAS